MSGDLVSGLCYDRMKIVTRREEYEELKACVRERRLSSGIERERSRFVRGFS